MNECEEDFEGECMVCGTGNVPPTGICSKECAEKLENEE